MKYALFFLLLLPISALAQKQKKYELVMDKYMRYYNAGQSDSLCGLFQEEHQGANCFWTTENIAKLKKIRGNIRSCKYAGIDTTRGRHVFKVVCEKEIIAITLTLDKENKIEQYEYNDGGRHVMEMIEK